MFVVSTFSSILLLSSPPPLPPIYLLLEATQTPLLTSHDAIRENQDVHIWRERAQHKPCRGNNTSGYAHRSAAEPVCKRTDDWS